MAGGSTLLDRVYVTTATAGTGTLTLGAAKSTAFCTVAEAGGTNGQAFTYVIEEGLDFEIGQGVYTSAGTTLTRATVYLSKIAGVAGTTKMTLAGAATVRLIAAKEDLTDASLFTSGTVNSARLPAANGFVAYNIYSATQTITIPAGATRALVKMVASGGGSGGANSASNVSAGGGSGSYLEKFLTGLTPGNTFALTIGAVGAAGTAVPGAGGTAGNSTLASGTQTITTLTVNGGVGSPAGTTGVTLGGAGGAISTNGDLNLVGRAGGDTNGGGSGTRGLGGIPPGDLGGAGGLGVKGVATVGLVGEVGNCSIEWYA